MGLNDVVNGPKKNPLDWAKENTCTCVWLPLFCKIMVQGTVVWNRVPISFVFVTIILKSSHASLVQGPNKLVRAQSGNTQHQNANLT